MGRRGPTSQQASVALSDRDREVIEALRAEHGLTFNAAIRYALRLVWIDMASTGADKRQRRSDVRHWLTETLAGRRPGQTE